MNFGILAMDDKCLLLEKITEMHGKSDDGDVIEVLGAFSDEVAR